MIRRIPVPDDLDIRFRCEECGYDLRGLPLTECCPECGRPVRDSMPGSHPGTPWQRDPRPGTLVRTVLMVMCRPRQTWERLQLGDDGHGLRTWSILLSGLLLSLCVGIPWLIIDRSGDGWSQPLVSALRMLLVLGPVAVIGMLGIWIELAVVETLLGFGATMSSSSRRSEIALGCRVHAAAIWPGVLLLIAVTATVSSLTTLVGVEERFAAGLLMLALTLGVPVGIVWHGVWLLAAMRAMRHRNHPATSPQRLRKAP